MRHKFRRSGEPMNFTTLWNAVRTADGFRSREITCPVCHGDGTFEMESKPWKTVDCPECHGSGTVPFDGEGEL